MGWIGLIGPNAPSVKTLDGRGRNGPYPLMAFGLPYIALAATEFIAPRPPDCGAGVWRAPPGTALSAARTPEVRDMEGSPLHCHHRVLGFVRGAVSSGTGVP